MRSTAILVAAAALSFFACTTPPPSNGLDVDDDTNEDNDEKRTRRGSSSTRSSEGPTGEAEPAPTPVDDAGTDAPTAAPESPERTCKDTAAVYAKAVESCGLDYQEAYDDFIDRAASGDCANIAKIRDEAALRGACFSYFKEASCGELLDFSKLPSACINQLQWE